MIVPDLVKAVTDGQKKARDEIQGKCFMNKRFRELMEQAGIFENQYTTEKFALLIVRECAQTLIDNTPVLDEYESLEDWDKGYDRAMKDCVHHIREHFGVRE